MGVQRHIGMQSNTITLSGEKPMVKLQRGTQLSMTVGHRSKGTYSRAPDCNLKSLLVGSKGGWGWLLSGVVWAALYFD